MYSNLNKILFTLKPNLASNKTIYEVTVSSCLVFIFITPAHEMQTEKAENQKNIVVSQCSQISFSILFILRLIYYFWNFVFIANPKS